MANMQQQYEEVDVAEVSAKAKSKAEIYRLMTTEGTFIILSSHPFS